MLTAVFGCASPSHWNETADTATHLPTGLLFPAKLGGLQRSPVGTPSNPAQGDSESVSYSSGATTELLITFVPVDSGSEPDLQEVLAERSRDYASSLPPGHGSYRGSLPVRCKSEPVSFAYRGFPARSTGWQSGSALRIGAEYDTEWWFAGQVSDHLVVIESHLRGDNGHTYVGADFALRVLFTQLGWPCELPYTTAERPDTASSSRSSAAKSWRRSARALLATIFPPAPPGKDSSIGVREIPRRPDPGTYAHARQSGEPHTCEVSAPSFFGETEIFDAYVEGDDFQASASYQHFARLEGIGYGWIEDEGNPRVVNEIRLGKYRTDYERLMHHPPPRWENSFVFVEPAPHEPCVPAPSQRIRVPEEGHRDVTDALVADQREYFDKAVDNLERMPFGLLLPHPSLKDLFPHTRGMASGSAYGLEYFTDALGVEGESSQLSIGFSAHTEESPASACNKALGRDCAPFVITDRGYEIFQNFQMTGSSSRNPRAPHYYARVGDALVHLSYLHWKRDSSGAIEFSAHEFAESELESTFDSLRSATPEDVVRFPGMAVTE